MILTKQVQSGFWLPKKRKQSLLPAIMSAGVPLKTRLNCSLIRKTDEIRAQSFRFLPVTSGAHTKTHWSRSTALKSSQNTRDEEEVLNALKLAGNSINTSYIE